MPADRERQVQVEADLSIARGLDYYTGTVFETRMAGFESLGSICSGGRYDSLATDGATTYPGVGISLGVTRMLVPLLARGGVTASRSVPVGRFRRAWPATRPAPSPRRSPRRCGRGASPARSPSSAQKYGRQIRAADRRGIPFVWFPAAARRGHEVKDIRSRRSGRRRRGHLVAARQTDRHPTIIRHQQRKTPQ